MYSDNSISPILSYVAQNMRTELNKITSSIEYAQLSGDLSALEASKYSSQVMLQLIDCYLGYMDRYDAYQQVEPVSLSALLSGIATSMAPYAKFQQCDLDLNVVGRYQPVMVNRDLLKTVLTSLSSIFIAAQSEVQHSTRPVIVYAVKKTGNTISAGIYSSMVGINGQMLSTARKLYNRPGNPINATASSGSAGLYIADSLLDKISLGLRVSKLNNMTGLAADFEPSSQLALV